MKAAAIDGLDPDGTLADNLRRIVAVRAGEIEALAPSALEPTASAAQHDLRIAAKRLRYVLELAAPALGEPAGAGAKAARALQGSLGEIHDCDELLTIARERGIEPLVAHLEAQREPLFEAFERDWHAFALSPDLQAPAARGDGASA